MQKIEIETMTFQDVGEVFDIEKNNFSQYWSRESFMSALDNQNSFMIVAKAGKDVIGYAGMYHVADEGYMYNIAVDCRHRGKGVGTQLMMSLINHSKNLNLSFLSLEVRESNHAAIYIYKKLGFHEVGKRKNFYIRPIEDALIMTLKF